MMACWNGGWPKFVSRTRRHLFSLAPHSCPPKPAFGRRRMRGEGWGEGLFDPRALAMRKDRYPLTRRAKSAATSPRKRGEVSPPHRRDNPNRRISVRATPNGAGVNGPGGALVISITKPRAKIASQKVSQNPSI